MSDYEWRLRVKYSPDQPRVPAGDPRGGQWTGGQATGREIPGTHTTVYEVKRGQKLPPEVVEGGEEVTLVLSPEGVLGVGVGWDLDSHATLVEYLGDTERYDQYVRGYVSAHKSGFDALVPGHRLPFPDQRAVFDETLYSGRYSPWQAVGRLSRAMVAAGFDPKLPMNYTKRGGLDIEATVGEFTDWKQFKARAEKYSPDQPRVPAGQPGGGRWTSGGGTAAAQFEDSEPNAFRAALDDNLDPRYEAFVTKYTPEEYEEMGARTYVHEGGRTGFAIKPDGDIISVFSGDGKGRLALQAAIELGGKKLDCFDGFLPGFYGTFGFKEYDRWTWDDQYAPDGWSYAKFGRPDVVLMRREA